jgi:hypothetical protein
MKKVIVNPIFRDTVTFIKTSAETKEQFTEAELTLMPGGRNPLHYHLSYSETFTAIDGELGVGLADMNLPGFFTLISPLLKRLAKKAKDSGIEQLLIDRYCR